MSAYKYLDYPTRGRHVSFLVPFLEEMTGHYVAFALFPAVLLFARRFPASRKHWLRTIAVSVPAVAIFSLTHTLLNLLSRTVLFPVFGLGHYDYGIMRIRYVMEFPQDVIGFTLMIFIIWVSDLWEAKRQREIAAVELESNLAQAQLQNLRLQLQPHFLFNALNTISSVMYEDVDAADEMISRLSEFLRLTLSSSPAQEVRLSEELRFLDLYLNIMRARFEDKLRVRMEIEPGLEDALVPQLILQPLVENSIRHGVHPASGEVDIDVTAKRDEAGGLAICVRDRGRGIPANGDAKQNILERGIGLANTAKRLDRLYGAKHRLDFENASDGGLIVSVLIPFHA